MRFFLDNSLPPRLAKAIDELLDEPHEAVHLQQKFRPDTGDVEWITALADEGDWVVITADLRITCNAHERKAWQQSGLTAFFLAKGWANQKLWPQAARLIQWFPDIVDQARKVAPGAGFIVPFKYSGKFEQPSLT